MIKNFVINSWDGIMNQWYNPLKYIPDLQVRHMVLQILAWLWCIAFGLYEGSVIYMAVSLVAHMGILFMIMFTASIFYDAERRGDSWILALRIDQLRAKIKENRKKLNKSVWNLDKEA